MVDGSLLWLVQHITRHLDGDFRGRFTALEQPKRGRCNSVTEDGSKKRPDIEDELRARDEVPDDEISDIILRAAQLEAESKVEPKTTTVDQLIQMGRDH